MTGDVHQDEELQARQNRLIDDACAQAVKSRLRGHASGGASSDLPTAYSGVDSPPADSFAGYQLIREIHRGGQGVVYQAIQGATRRKVAIKVMKEGPFASTADRARFEREVHILGQLQHPNIVTIHDTGIAAGHHFFVMDYISGQPLDVYMASGLRSVDETLRLFATICDAVNAAHLRGVIHRDLKPGNIRIDPNGEPHILDFGLAKLAVGASDASMMTTTGAFVGSPPWASPEQAEGILAKIDTRTDVYSLGVILYQMLTGKLPYDVTGNIRDVLDRIQNVAPNRPGAVRKGINDEVDTIVLKCLAKERERRYQTAGELARDVRHYLAGDPIEAKRDSVRYVLLKQLRKHKLPVAIAAAFVLVVTLGFATSVGLWRQVVRERDIAEAARLNEGRQRKVAEAVNAFLQDTLSAANPDKVLGHDVMVRTMLDAAARQVEEGPLRGEPETEAAVRNTIGVSYRELGLYEPAEVQLHGALELRKRLFGEQHPEVAASHLELARLMFEKGQFRAAESLGRKALVARRQFLGEEHADVGVALDFVALTLQWQGDLDAAEPLHRQALTKLRRSLGTHHLTVAKCVDNLAMVLFHKGEYAEAEKLSREALAVRTTLLGDQHPDVTRSRNNLALIVQQRGYYDEANRELREALRLNQTLLPPGHPKVALSLSRLATNLLKEGNHEEAQQLYLEALAIARGLENGEDTVAIILNNLASLHLKNNDVSLAEPLAREAVDIHRRLDVPQRVPFTYALVTLGEVLVAKGDPSEAHSVLSEALAVEKTTLGERHWLRAYIESLFGACLTGLQQYDAAEPLLLNSYRWMKEHGQGSPHGLDEFVDRIVRLYESWKARADHAEKAAEYRSLLSPPPYE